MINETNDDNKLVDIDWQSHLNYHYPNLAKLYFSKGKMHEINAKLTKRNLELEKHKNSYPASFYDHFIHVIDKKGINDRRKIIANGLLNFLEQQVIEFTSLTNGDPVLFEQLKSQMEDLFWDNDAKYLDRVGELLSTNYLIKKMMPARLSSLKHYFFLKNNEIDHKGPDADLCFIQPNGQKIIIDIFSINSDHQKIADENGLQTFFDYRINQKWISKKFDDPLLPDRYEEILIQPFLWLYDLPTIETYRTTLANLNNTKALPILILQQLSNADGKVFYKCVPMS